MRHIAAERKLTTYEVIKLNIAGEVYTIRLNVWSIHDKHINDFYVRCNWVAAENQSTEKLTGFVTRDERSAWTGSSQNVIERLSDQRMPEVVEPVIRCEKNGFSTAEVAIENRPNIYRRCGFRV